MSLIVICPSCGNSLKAPAEHVGRRAKCPKCGGSITITESKRPAPPAPKPSAPEKKPSTEPAPAKPQVSETPSPPPVDSPAKAKSPQPRKYARSHMVGAAFVALIGGYVAGSYHPMDEMFGEFMEASKTIVENYRIPARDILGDALDVSDPTEQPLPFREGRRGGSVEFEDSADAETPLLAIGDEHQADGFSIALTDARIERGGSEPADAVLTAPSETTRLMCSFVVANTDEEQTISVRGSELFAGRRFSIRDADGNRVRGVELAIADVADPQSLSDDIRPGDQRTYVAHFTIPQRTEEELTLSVNLEAFGGTGRIRFEIPAAEINETPPGDS